eukprot:6082641-Amphidinium_carterae.1
MGWHWLKKYGMTAWMGWHWSQKGVSLDQRVVACRCGYVRDTMALSLMSNDWNGNLGWATTDPQCLE